ncbi:MAG: HAMP domain-containing sensor histidine kinase [Gaiellaceae bacterium]
MIGLAVVVAATTLFVGGALALALRLLPTVNARLVGLALLCVALPLAAVLLSGVAMFHMGADLVVLAVAAAASSVAVGAALLLTRSITVPLERLRAASSALAGGDFDARAPERGPAELAEVGRSFNETASRLEELFDARRQLVAWASHDLRTPLASLQAMLEAVEDGIVPAQHYHPAMREQVRTLGLLVSDLFELAQIDSGALTLELIDAEVGPLVDSCLRGLEAEASARRVRLGARVESGVPEVRIASEKVERVLLNLVTNAIRHTPSDGSVAVVVRTWEDEIEVAVEDTGEGLAPGAERRMFERFWRGDSARTASRGEAGLGLAIARGLVEAHGGRIWAENRPGGGARVAFTLPRT